MNRIQKPRQICEAPPPNIGTFILKVLWFIAKQKIMDLVLAPSKAWRSRM